MPHRLHTHAPRPRAAWAALPALVLVLAACSSGSGSQAPASQEASSQAPASAPASAAASAPASPAGGGTTVTISNLAFGVDEITVPVGNLTFVNGDSVQHVLAEGENGVEVADPRVQKVTINPNSQGDLVFSVAGDYHITCLIHKTMNMEVHVQ